MPLSLPPAIDYTNKDFASLRQAMLDLARYRLPEWTDQSPADLGMVLVDLFAYMGDIVSYYQDRIANESFLLTATERRSVLHLLRLIGYELQPPVAASAELTLTFKPPPGGIATIVTIPQGARFETKANGGTARSFEYLGPTFDILIPGTTGKFAYRSVPVRHSQVVPVEVIGSSTGEANQQFALSQHPLILESLVVEVDEGAGFVTWERRDSLLYYISPSGRVTLSGADSRDYYVQFDENDVAYVVFGDGVYGLRPPVRPNNIRASYRVGGGGAGNVPAGSITEAKTPISLLDSVINEQPAAGGADHESIDHAVRFGPLAFRSGQRAVTLSDFVALAFQAGGVAKVRARSRDWNQIDLYIAPEGDTCRAVPEDLKKRIVAFFEDKRMAGTFVQVQDPTAVPIDVSVDVELDAHFRADQVRPAVELAVSDLLAFKNVDFGQPVYLSQVFGAVETIPGVRAVNVTRFRRQDSPAVDFAAQLQSVGIQNVSQLPEFIQRAMQVDVEKDGRIDIGEFEIPTLGVLVVSIKELPR